MGFFGLLIPLIDNFLERSGIEFLMLVGVIFMKHVLQNPRYLPKVLSSNRGFGAFIYTTVLELKNLLKSEYQTVSD